MTHEVKFYRVRHNPTYIYMVGGKEVRRATGTKSLNGLKTLIRKPWM